MTDADALLEALRHAGDPDVVRALEILVRTGADQDLARINALQVAAMHGLDEEAVIGTCLHASRLGLFEMSWNILCASCGGVLDANATLKTVRQDEYYCAFCDVASETQLDDRVEVSFAVSPRVRRIGAHDQHTLPFWDYQRQVFFGTGIDFPEPAEFERLARACLLESLELGPGERMILALQLPALPVIIGDSVTHTSYFVDVSGEPATERQDMTIVFDGVSGSVGHVQLRPGPLRLSLDNRAQIRALPGIFVVGPELDALIGRRRAFLTAKRLLSNQTFRDIYRTDTLEVDQRLKILSLTFLFTDLKGSTALYERVGDLVAYDLVRAHFRVLTEIVASEGGAVVKTIGDAVMATFPTPGQAVSAALRMRHSMRQLNAERAAEDLILKIGLHEGPCLAVSLNDRQDYFGHTVNIASRVQESAAGDSIFATEPVVGHAGAAAVLAANRVTAAPRGRELRSIGERLPIYELASQ